MNRLRKERTFILLFSLLFSIAMVLHCHKKLKMIKTENRLKQRNTLILATRIHELANNIRIATYPSECDDRTKEIIGEECDLGNYMEWAGPALEDNTQQLLLYLQGSQQ